jgi:hypothetical protein
MRGANLKLVDAVEVEEGKGADLERTRVEKLRESLYSDSDSEDLGDEI